MELRPLAKLLIGLVGVGAIVGAVLVGRYGGLDVERSSDDSADRTLSEEDWVPPLSPEGPYPKVVVDESEYQFGVMGVGSTKNHIFTIRNEGDAPLVLWQGPSNCSCTISKLGDDGKVEVLPGGSTTVELEWEPENAAEVFRKSAAIGTNDPEQRTFVLSISGRVEPVIHVRPNGAWAMGSVRENSPQTVSGTIFSRVRDGFQIKGPIKSSSPLLTATARPLSSEKRDELQAKCGYAIEATLTPDMPVGPFRKQMTVPTDVPGFETIEIYVEGVRQGPLSIVAPPGNRWDGNLFYLDLGRFQAKTGARAKLTLFVTPPEEGPFQVQDVETDPDFLQATTTRDPEFQAKSREKHELAITVPAGSPPVTRGSDNPAKVRLKTNHPGMQTVVIRVQFDSY